MYRRILVTLDGSGLALRDFPYARLAAPATGAEVELMAVIEPVEAFAKSRVNEYAAVAPGDGPDPPREEAVLADRRQRHGASGVLAGSAKAPGSIRRVDRSVRSRTARWSWIGLFLVLTTACGVVGPTPDVAATVDAGVTATVAAQTPPTPTSPPLAMPTPTADPYPYLHPFAHLLKVAGIVPGPDSNFPIVLLRSVDDDRYLPIQMSTIEALWIAAEMEDLPAKRPLPHHLFGSAITALGGQVRYVVIARLDEGFYYTHVVLDQQGGTIELDARPSDAIALALAARAPIYAEPRVLDVAGLVLPTPEATEEK